MKVRTHKTVEIDVEVDVAFEDCLNTLAEILADNEGPRRKLAALDQLTRMFESCGPEHLNAIVDEATRSAAAILVRKRLSRWIAFLIGVETVS